MKELFTKNLRLKVVSVILAISLEIYFISPHNLISYTLDAPIEFINVPPSMTIVSPPRAEEGLTAIFKVRGPSPLVQQVIENPRKFTVSLPDSNAANYTVQLDPAQLRLPSGVELVELNPAKIEMRLERLVRKELAVAFDASGETAPGYRLSAVRISPEVVVAKGPEHELKGVGNVETQPVENLKEIKSSQTLELPLKTIGQNTSLNVNFATVELKVIPRLAERMLENVRVRVLGPDGYGVAVSPARVKLLVTGPEESLQRVNEKQIEVEVDARRMTQGQHELPFGATLPEGIDILSATPARVSVSIIGQGHNAASSPPAQAAQ